MSGPYAIEVWKKARETIDHFDKILSDFRKIAFGVDAIVAPALLKIWFDLNDEKVLMHVGLVALGWNLFNFLIWLAEKHYHIYLLAAVHVARESEKIFGENALTKHIGDAKKKQLRVPFLLNTHLHFYDLIYLAPMFFATVLIFLFNPWIWFLTVILELVLVVFIIKRDAAHENPNYRLTKRSWFFSVVFFVILTFLMIVVVKHHFYFEQLALTHLR
jgi:small-conductance mechanosensitive channel